MNPTGVPAPGWFTDPGDPSVERWWSGEAWTDYTRSPEPEPAYAAASTEPALSVAFAEPVTAAPTAAALDGFVMPELSAEPLLATPPEAPYTPPATPAPPISTASVPPAYVVPSAPSSLPSTADPDIALHYRQALNTPEPLPASLAPPLTGSPDQPGWGGMPLPQHGGIAAGGYDPSGGYRAPDHARTLSSYAAARTAANATVRLGDNKVAKVALSTGLSSLAALALIFFGRILIVPSLLSLVAIATGIVGLALVKRAGSGLWPALGGLLMGLATAIAVGVSILLAVVDAAAVDTHELEVQIVEDSLEFYGVDVVSANCPRDVSILTTTSFSCTAIDSSGVAYPVDVEITDDGYVWWELRV